MCTYVQFTDSLDLFVVCICCMEVTIADRICDEYYIHQSVQFVLIGFHTLLLWTMILGYILISAIRLI